MRVVSLVLIALLSLTAASVDAASISPNPVNETRDAGSPGGSLNANLVALSVTPGTATFQLSIVTGSVTGIVTFRSAIQVGFFGTVNFDNGFITTQSYQVVPEPRTLAFTGLALALWTAARRRLSVRTGE
jgi:hypothetical protein